MEKEVSYNVEVSSHYSDWPIGSASLEDFTFDEFINSDNFRVKNFDLLVVKKFIRCDQSTKIRPVFLIYNRDIWEPKYNIVNKNTSDRQCKTTLESNHHSLTF